MITREEGGLSPGSREKGRVITLIVQHETDK